jgi:peroxiredoxin
MLLAWACLGPVAACGGGSEGGATADLAQPAGGADPAQAAEGGDPGVEAAALAAGGTMAPDFALPDLAGNTVTMASLRGKLVVVDFWATWCPPCLFQIPILNSVQSHHRDAGVVVIGVAVDVEGGEVVKPFAEENDIEYTVLLGDDGLARKFGARGFPALAIVAPDGRIDSVHVGLIEEADLDQAIARILGVGPS